MNGERPRTDVNIELGGVVMNPRVAAIIERAGAYLVHDQDTFGAAALPGGRIRTGETSRDALLHELREELGCEPTTLDLVFVNENFFTHRERRYHEIGFYYRVKFAPDARIYSEDPVTGVEGDREIVFHWVPADRLEAEDVVPVFLRKRIAERTDGVSHVISGG